MKVFRVSKWYNRIISLENELFGKSLNSIYKIDDDINVIILLKNDSVIGFLTYKLFGNTADIYNIAIDKNNQNNGFGLLLLKEISVFDICLEVDETNIQAIKLYEKFNFTSYDKIDNYYDNRACIKMIRQA